MASTRPKRATTSEVDGGWDISAPAATRPFALSVLGREAASGAIDSKALDSEAPDSEAGYRQGEEVDDGWSLECEEVRPRSPRLEVVGGESAAVPVPIHDDGWAISCDLELCTAVEAQLRLSASDTEEAFFLAGEQLAESSEPPDTFDDLDQPQENLWHKLLTWWRAAAGTGRRKR